MRRRLVVLLGLAAAGLAFDSYLDVMDRRDRRVSEVQHRMVLVAQNAAVQQAEFVESARLLLGVITKLAPSLDICGEGFKQISTAPRWLMAISIADRNGSLACSTGPLKPGTTVMDRAYYQEALKTRDFVLSDYLVGRVHNMPIVIAAAPRIDAEGEIESVIILTIDLSFLDEVSEKLAGEDTTVLLVDGSNTVVSANNKSTLQGKNVSENPLFAELAKTDGQVVAGEGPDGIDRLYISAPLAGTRARTIIGFPEAKLMQPVYDAMREEFGKNVLLFIALMAIAWVLAESIVVRPIRAFTHAALAYGVGNREARVDPEALPRDFSELARTFNAAVDLVSRNEALIVEKNRHLAEANARLSELARLDELTGLANRRLLNARLAEVFAGSRPEEVALMVLDLDKFKRVNDLMGHPVGDLVLKEAARRLKLIAREQDLVARLGGDEFAIVVALQGEEWRPRQMARDILRAMASPFPIRGGHVEIGGTVGLALSVRDASAPDDLLRAADLAMYRAKRDERGGYCFFEKSMHAELQSRVSLESELHTGIRDGEIIPYYQPIVDLESGRIVGLEILARWNHPLKGILPPDVFIGVASDVGLMESMTRLLLAAACRDAKSWPEDITLSINLSPQQLSDPMLPGLMASIATEWGIAPSRLEIEVTEDALIQDFPAAQAIMQAFRSHGMQIALDDFGTGYSSLQNLHELRFDKIKIDRSFVTDLLNSEDSRKLVNAIVGLARTLNMPVIAEGIEDIELTGVLRAIGCTYGQGYAFGRPMPARDVGERLRKGPADRARVA